MGSLSNQIRNFISIAHNYQLKRSEKDLNQLQRQLQILSVVNDLKLFEPASMESVQFYVCLENLLLKGDSKSTLSWKIINLLCHICRSSSVRIALRDDIQFLPTLTSYLTDPKTSSDKVLKTLQLMQEISYGIKINHMHMWVKDLIPHLIEFIIKTDTSEAVTIAALSTLNNLCRKSPIAAHILRSYSVRKQLLQSVLRHKNSDYTLKLLSAELPIFFVNEHSLVIDEIAHIINIIFKVSFDSKNVQLIQLASDVLEEITNFATFEEAIQKYEDFHTNINHLITCLHSDASPPLVSSILNVLRHVVKIGHPDIKALVGNILEKALPWMYDKDCGLNAIRLMEVIYIYADDSLFNSYHNDIIASVQNAIQKEGLEPTTSELNRLNITLKFVEEISRKDQSFQLKLSMAISPEDLSSLLKTLMTEQSSIANMNETINSTLTSLSSGYNSFSVNQSFNQAYTNNNVNKECKHTEGLFNSLQQITSEAIVRTISVAKILGKQKADYMMEYDKILSLPNIMKHVVQCSNSKDETMVALAFQILCAGNIPEGSIKNLVNAQLESNRNNGVNLPSPVPDKYDLDTSMNCDHFSTDVVDKVMRAIQDLKNVTDAKELRNIPLTDVMDMYEYVISDRERSQTLLQDTLDSMDRYNRQLQHSLLQSKAENDRLKYLLKSWERHLQDEKNNNENLKTEINNMQKMATEQRSTLLKSKTEAERKVDRYKLKIGEIENELSNKMEEIRRYDRSVNELQNENKKLQKYIKEEKDIQQQLHESVNTLKSDVKKQQREKDEMLKDNQQLEKNQAQLKSQVSELELLISSHEKTIAEKETAIDDLHKNLQMLKRMQDMIHNITSGKC